MDKIVFVAHCILNTSSKVVMDESPEMDEEMELRKQLLLMAAQDNLQVIQLPCPEFTQYGSQRWGHVKEQFDNVFFKTKCKEQLERPLQELSEYLKYPNRFQVLGIIGVEGSPSCGVGLTCSGPWGSSPASGKQWASIVDQCKMINEAGVMIDVLLEELSNRKIEVPVYGLTQKTLDVLREQL